MEKFEYGLSLKGVCDAIEAYRKNEDDVPEAGVIAAFKILLADSPYFRDLEDKLRIKQNHIRLRDTYIEELEERAEEAEAQRDKLAAENAGMDRFVDSLLSIAWQGSSADGSDIQELALKHGLIRQESYSPECHENLVEDAGNFEEGDEVYFRVEIPATDAYLNSVRAEGIHFAANRILAAWKSCLIKAMPAEAYDVSGAVLPALEFLPKANLEDFKRAYADQVRDDIAEILRACKDGA